MSELTLRTLAGLAMIALALVAVVAGSIVLWVLCSVAGLIMMSEWCGLHRVAGRTRRLAQLTVAVPLAAIAPIAWGPGFFTLGLIAGAAFFVVIVTRKPPLAVGVVYVALPVLSLLLIRRQEEGVVFALWTLALVWMCDIGAYFAGRAIGGPKLAPAISPNKTVAGLAGGVIAASVFGAFMHWYAGLPWRLTLATPVLAVIAQAGDLYESWLKRRVGIKDSGNILPGHGGLLDRLDGLVAVAPVAALLVMLPKVYP